MTRTLPMLAIAISAVSCAGLTQFNVPLTATGEVMAGPQTAGQITDNGSAQGAISTAFSSNGVTTFKGATISQATLFVTAANPTLAPSLSAFTVTISATGQPDVEIAHATSETLATKATSYALTLDSVELKPYIVAGQVAVQATPTFVSMPETDVKLEVDMTLDVQVL